MIKIDEYIEEEKLGDRVRLLIQVHDELDYEIHESVKDKAIAKIKELMESVLTLEETEGVPIVANAETGRSWGELVMGILKHDLSHLRHRHRKSTREDPRPYGCASEEAS